MTSYLVLHNVHNQCSSGSVWKDSLKIQVSWEQGIFSPAGVRVFSAGNPQNPQEILTKTLIIEQMLWYFDNFNQIFSQNRLEINMEYVYNVSIVCGVMKT